MEEEDDVEETITNNNADNDAIGLDEAIEQFAMSYQGGVTIMSNMSFFIKCS